MRAGVDTGGTFTDVVLADGRVVKVLSTPDDPAGAVAAGIAGAPVDDLAHGTTVATNALLQRRLATVALVTDEGLEDVIEIARQDRPHLYDPFADRPEPLVPRALRFGVPGRLGADGQVIAPVEPDDIPPLPDGVDVVAVCLVHSDLEPAHERRVAEALARRGHAVVCSHEVSPEPREYERTVTTVANAALGPVCGPYLERVAGLADRVSVMASAGGLMLIDRAVRLPATLLVSGPAAGARAAAWLADRLGFPLAVSFDMGGTSTDVCLLAGGLPEPAPVLEVGGFPIRLPSLAIQTIGAGGGSIARVDPGGALAVGPLSAGAWPGPACYGRGGSAPTVTDADLLVGRIPADHPFPGLGQLDVSAARAAFRDAGFDPTDVVTVVDARMEQAVRRVTVEDGVDPAGAVLVAFGGAGPLHACAIAEALGMVAVVVPPRAGVFSAVGLLGAPTEHHRVHTWPRPLDHDGAREAAARLAAEAAGALGPGAVAVAELDCRYLGQSHELRLAADDLDRFHDLHERRNGWADPAHPVEVVAVRAVARLAAPVALDDLPAVARRPVRGPAVVAEEDCTIWVPGGWEGRVAGGGALVLERR